MSDLKHLLSPITVRGKTFKNRITAAPTGTSIVTPKDGRVPRNELDILRAKVNGGFSLVSIGETAIDGEYSKKVGFVPATDFNDLNGVQAEGWKRYFEAAKGEDNLAFVEIFHCGDSRRMADGGPKVAYGPDSYVASDGIQVFAMDEDMMEIVCERFGQAAYYLKEIGFDGVCVHAAHGWMFSQFLSPLTNHRTDEYGGSIDNRCRFPIRVIERIRSRVGEDFLIEVRVSGEERVPGGMHVDEMAVFCQKLEGIADIIHVSSGCYRDATLSRTYSNFFDNHFVNLEQGAYIKEHTNGLLVNLVGGINDPVEADRLIGEGKIDLIALGRQAFADFEFPNKCMSGNIDDINRCTRCMWCMGGGAPPKRGDTEAGPPMPKGDTPEEMLDNFIDMFEKGRAEACPVNPWRNFIMPEGGFTEPQGFRKVMVIGGGVAGIQAATSAAERGHKVTLVEKTGKLGGIINFTDVDNFKSDLRNQKDLMIHRLKKKDVRIILNTTADRDLIKEEAPDVIIAAVGSSPLIPDLAGIENTVPALDVYGDVQIGENVVVCGGGLAGCEVALHLAANGKKVHVIEMMEMIAPDAGGGLRSIIEEQFEKYGVKQFVNKKVTSISADKVIAIDADGKDVSFQADNIINAFGMKSNTDELEKIKDAAGEIPIKPVGDCVEARKMCNAIGEGLYEAYSII